MTPEQRINELTKRQVFYDSSFAVKLNAVNGRFFYKVYAWLDQLGNDVKVLMKEGKYNGEDPLDLTKLVLDELNAKKIKLGNLVNHSPQAEARV